MSISSQVSRINGAVSSQAALIVQIAERLVELGYTYTAPADAGTPIEINTPRLRAILAALEPEPAYVMLVDSDGLTFVDADGKTFMVKGG